MVARSAARSCPRRLVEWQRLRRQTPGMSEAEEVTYDSSACYAHSEYELGDMKM